ncbi:MAG: alpha/beta hydrolase [Deltaproteobacteria bacterium]|nr:alpha/beta hydrolase [Deltaproteobacteria bacterium]
MRIFIHGLESSNQGAKAVFFRERFPDMSTPNFPGSLEERMEKLNGILSGKDGIIIVGSSFGGLMGSIYVMENEFRVEKLILLAPAINILGLTEYPEKRVETPVWVFHGTDDEVIPLKEVQSVAARCFSNLIFHVVEDDHFLHRTFQTLDWPCLLRSSQDPA